MTTKHFCDECGKEVSKIPTLDFSIMINGWSSKYVFPVDRKKDMEITIRSNGKYEDSIYCADCLLKSIITVLQKEK
jgi:hypothetical protein